MQKANVVQPMTDSDTLTAARLAELKLCVEVDSCLCGEPGEPEMCEDPFSGKPKAQRCKRMVEFPHRARLVRALRLLEMLEDPDRKAYAAIMCALDDRYSRVFFANITHNANDVDALFRAILSRLDDAEGAER